MHMYGSFEGFPLFGLVITMTPVSIFVWIGFLILGEKWKRQKEISTLGRLQVLTPTENEDG